MNILMLSVGTRNKVVQYFKEALDGDGIVITTDMSKLAPALYEGDKHYIVPRITEPGYINIILDICKKERVNGVLSLIDPELSLLAANKDKFEKIGTKVIGSSYELCEMALDKMKMYKWLKNHGYNCARSYVDKELFFKDVEKCIISYPVFIKPVRGSASIGINKAYDKETVDLLFNHHDNLIIQEYLKGEEIGADCYIDMCSKEVVSIFTKKKILMRAGETDKSVSFKDEKLFALLERFITECGWIGPIDIDIFKIKGDYYISEINPRFGGGYPHAYCCGVNHMQMIKNNLNGIANEKRIGLYEEGIYIMKYNEIMIK